MGVRFGTESLMELLPIRLGHYSLIIYPFLPPFIHETTMLILCWGGL